jgi:hypothetical protein
MISFINKMKERCISSFNNSCCMQARKQKQSKLHSLTQGSEFILQLEKIVSSLVHLQSACFVSVNFEYQVLRTPQSIGVAQFISQLLYGFKNRFRGDHFEEKIYGTTTHVFAYFSVAENTTNGQTKYDASYWIAHLNFSLVVTMCY